MIVKAKKYPYVLPLSGFHKAVTEHTPSNPAPLLEANVVSPAIITAKNSMLNTLEETHVAIFPIIGSFTQIAEVADRPIKA